MVHLVGIGMVSLQSEKIDIDRNILLKRLNEFDTFRNLLQNQWHHLQQNGTISITSLSSFIDANIHLIKKSVIKNVNTYPIDGYLYHDANTFQQEIDLIK